MEENKEKGTVTFTKKEFESKLDAVTYSSIGAGVSMVGIILLFDKKIEKTTSSAIILTGLLFVGGAALFRKIDTSTGNG